MTLLRALIRDRGGAAAAEMALVTPLLCTLMFGGAEIANFFWEQHVVTKGVRDGARYAGRLPFSAFTCAGLTNGATGAEATSIKNVAATGQVGGTTTRFAAFTASTITLSVSCSSTTTTGIYASRTGGAPLIRVSASVPYTALFSTWFLPSGIRVKASDQAAVMGV